MTSLLHDQENLNVLFLTYLNRSGSTYLASKLATFESVGVGIEARFVDGWIEPGFDLSTPENLESYLDALFETPKFQAWNVDRKLLTAVLNNKSYPLSFSDILLSSLELFFADKRIKTYVHKCGEYYLCVEKIRNELPDAKFIFVDRDPRAIYNSQSKSRDSQTGRIMQDNILHFAFGYMYTQEILTRLKGDENFLVISYERLLADEEQELSSILPLLHKGAEKGLSKRSYMDDVPSDQKHLHKNVEAGTPVFKRINGWQSELSAGDILFLQKTLNKYLITKGYALFTPKSLSKAEYSKFIFNLYKFRYEFLKRKLFHISHKY